MADRGKRTAQEREAARRERAARRAARRGASPPAHEPPAHEPPAHEPPAHEPPAPVREEPAPPLPVPQPLRAVQPPAPVREEPALPPRAPVPEEPALRRGRRCPRSPHCRRRRTSRSPRPRAPRRRWGAPVGIRPPIKSFPSPPDPEFYAPDDELEVPAGTRRVSRLTGPRRHTGPRPAKRRPPQPGKRHRWRGRIASLVALVVAAALIWFLIELFQPFGTSPHGRVTVTIPPSTSSTKVGDQLARAGVISSSFFFELRATLAGDRGDIRAGTYRLQRGMSYGAVLTKLTTPPRAARTTELTIADGHTRQAVDHLLRRQGIRGSYLAASRNSPILDPHAYGAPRHVNTLEGFLFPDTFRLVTPVKVSDLVDDQLRDFKRRFATVRLGYAHRRNLTDYDVLRVASLIEGEAARPRDRPLVASVIYNRLRDHMMLQLDSTTRYATGNFTAPLTESELRSGLAVQHPHPLRAPADPDRQPGAGRDRRRRSSRVHALPVLLRQAVHEPDGVRGQLRPVSESADP